MVSQHLAKQEAEKAAEDAALKAKADQITQAAIAQSSKPVVSTSLTPTSSAASSVYDTQAIEAPRSQADQAAQTIVASSPPNRAPTVTSLAPTSVASSSIYGGQQAAPQATPAGIKSLPARDFGPLLGASAGSAALGGKTRQLEAPAKMLSMSGRGGDSMLVHMSPGEVASLQGMARRSGKSMTINPYTGLPEAFKLKDLFNINTYTKPVRKAAEQVGLGGLSDALSSGFKTLGQNAQYILPFVPGGMFAGLGGLGSFAASPMGRGLLAGGIGSLAGGRFNLKRGLMSGLTAYGLSGAYQGLQAAGNVPQAAAAEGAVDPLAGFDEAAASTIERAGGIPPPRGMTEAELVQRTGEWAGTIKPTVEAAAPVAKAPGFMQEVEAAGRGLKNIAMGDKATSDAAMKAFGSKFGKAQMGATYMGATGMMALEEQEKQLEEYRRQQQISEAEYAERKSRIEAAKKRAMDALKANPYRFAIGGEINEEYKLQTPQLGGNPPDQRNVFGLARGGMPPRFLNGPGDGMSDSIKARIGGIQEARLADGEFVIPADVVSHLGNGSSKAGAKQLYSMMDRVRKARTGTTKQGKEIKPTKFMPA